MSGCRSERDENSGSYYGRKISIGFHLGFDLRACLIASRSDLRIPENANETGKRNAHKRS
jgi:hypothetical protein